MPLQGGSGMRDILLFQCGRARAIEALAGNRSALWSALALVLMQ